MVLELAILNVLPGCEREFESAFASAERILSSTRGYREHSLKRCLEKPSRYLLLVEWERLEDQTEGFRGSAGYQEWMALLHHFYDPFPEVEHYLDRE
jgi:heme-degrading monooxygenase HmoA